MNRPGATDRIGQRKRPRAIGTHLMMLAAGSVVCWSVVALAIQYFRTYTLAREATRLERRRHDLLAQNAALRAEIERLRTDDRYLEQLARGQLGMLRPGEIELVIVQAASTRQPTEHEPARSEVAPAQDPPQSFARAVRELSHAVRALLERALSRFFRSGPP